MSDPRIVLVTRKTRLQELVEKYNTQGQAKFYIEHLGQDFSDYLTEHDNYRRIQDSILRNLASSVNWIQVERSFLSTFVFSPSDIVYVLGQDGLVANTIKYLKDQPVIGINPDPRRWVGLLLPFTADKAASLSPVQLIARSKRKTITLGKVTLSGGQELLAVNDFYIGQRSHISSRYEIEYRGQKERQSSSGIIVSTGLGSTGWLKSVISGATRISSRIGGGMTAVDDASWEWDAEYLSFAVREPYISPSSGAELVFGRVERDEPLTIVSGMSDTGVIFSDGMEEDFLEFTSGSTARIGIAAHKAVLLQPG